MPTPNVLWEGKVDEVEARIVDMGGDDCYVEEKIDRGWVAPDDERSARIYMAAFLECRKALNLMFDRDMGNLNLRSGVTALENTGRILRRTE